LPQKDFCRVHRSYIVRLDKIREIDDHTIVMPNQNIPVSRNLKDQLMKALNKLKH
jgi:DNA-binding LytR/AlgR family response regulator